MGPAIWRNVLSLTMLYFLLNIPSPADGAQIRLVGSSKCSGRVEVYHDGQWGTVCDDDWGMDDALVVCRELGCGMASQSKAQAYFGKGSGEIWMDDVGCSGNESSLFQCSHLGPGQHNCDHSEDAGVICSGQTQNISLPSPQLSPSDTALLPGEELTLTCSISIQLFTPVLVKFYKDMSSRVNRTIGSGQTSETLTLSDVDISHQGSYTCSFSTQNGTSSLSNPARIIVVDLPHPSISLMHAGLVWGPVGPEVNCGHSFSITCSVSSRYPGGLFYLSFSGSSKIYSRPIVNHYAYFHFPAAQLNDQGNYSCVHRVNVSTRTFTSKVSMLLTVREEGLVSMLVGGAVGGLVLILLLLVSYLMWRRRGRQAVVEISSKNFGKGNEEDDEEDYVNAEIFSSNKDSDGSSHDYENGGPKAISNTHTEDGDFIYANTDTCPGWSRKEDQSDEDEDYENGEGDYLYPSDFPAATSVNDNDYEEEDDVYANYE